MPERTRAIDTQLVHAGEPEPRISGAVAMPIFQSSTFHVDGDVGYHDQRYIRLNNTPNHEVLGRKLAAVAGAEAALVTNCGMSAISTSLITVLSPGDHLLAQNCLYGGTHDFVTEDFPDFGIEVDFIDGEQPETWEAKKRPNTKAIYVESITNPLVQVADLDAAVAFARRHGLVSMIDNTFASPINYRPIERGFDISLHSATKYLNGHNDIVAGVVIGRAEMVERIRHKLNHYGGSLDPHACFLLHRGLKTLAVRVRHQNASALKIARFLESHDAVVRVNYPGLESNAGHQRAKQWFAGFGGMLSFELKGGEAAAAAVVEGVTIPVSAPSLGGVDSLITIPAKSSHAGLSRAERKASGIAEGLVRLSVGVEDADDLIEDLRNALDQSTSASTR